MYINYKNKGKEIYINIDAFLIVNLIHIILAIFK